MSGPQFVHLQTFSRKPNPAGQSVSQVLGELARNPEFSRHLESPKPPELVDGLSPFDLMQQHDLMIQNAKVEVRVKGKVKHRAVRKDRHTLMTVVASYPIPWERIKDNPEEMKDLRSWEGKNIAFFKQMFGKQYQSTVRHTDEEFPHLHIFALPELVPGIDATALHPGKRAKQKAEELARKEGLSAREAVAIGNKELKRNMRKFQDIYYTHVGEPCGLLRLGPKRQRLTRKVYQAQKHAARLRSESVLEVKRENLERDREQLEAEKRQVSEQKTDLSYVHDYIKSKYIEIEEREAQVSKAAGLITACTQKLCGILNSIGQVFNIPAFKSIGEGLDKLEEVANSVKQEMSVESDDTRPEGPSW